MSKRLTSQDWHDAADLIQQGMGQAEACECEMNTVAGKNKAVEWLGKLALKAGRKALDAEDRENKSKT